MRYALFTSHPYGGSFHAAAADMICRSAEKNGHTIRRVDLVKDGFHPVMEEEDLRLWGEGKSRDPLVSAYQKAIEEADVLIFPFPIWWGLMPAVLKGFCDKVLLPEWAYRYDDDGEMVGLLTDKKAIVIITMETPRDFYQNFLGDPVGGAFIKCTLQQCGINVLHYLQIDNIISGGRAYAEQRLSEIASLIQ